MVYMARGRKKTQKFKRANGTGCIKKLSGNRRKPYAALVTTGKEWNEEKLIYKQIQKVIGTFKTEQEAYLALEQYKMSPYDIDKVKITFSEVYNEWFKRHSLEIGSSNIRTITSAYDKIKPIHERQFTTITITDLRDTINNAVDKNGKHVSAVMQGRIKSMFNLIYDYAVENEIVQVNLARQFHIKNYDKKVKRERKDKLPISPEHETMLWNNVDYGYIPMILIGIYTGFRPHELCVIERANVNLDGNYIIGGEKTEAGKDRYVPIHPKIKSLVEFYYNQSNGFEYLINAFDGQRGSSMTYDKYRGRFKNAFRHCNIDTTLYSPHCTRHTFITRAKEVRMDDEAIKLIVGHEFHGDVTAQVYDHADKRQYLQEQIRKIE